MTYLTMPRFRLLFFVVCCTWMSSPIQGQELSSLLSTSSGQLTAAQMEAMNNISFQIDTVATNIGLVTDVDSTYDLTGYNTYRILLNTNSPTDQVTALYGYDGVPLYLSTTGTFFQSPIGAHTPQGNNPLLFPIYPSLIYDSWLTIGIEQQPNSDAGEGPLVELVADNQNWIEAFEAGDSFAMSNNVGGGLISLPSDANGIAGDDLQVLLAQLTTDGDINGTLQVQLFVADSSETGEGTGQVTLTQCINDVLLNPEDDTVCSLDLIYGCMDSLACNYNPDALIEDGGCWSSSPTRDCDSNCLNDADGDNICDEEEVPGCTLPGACNFNLLATDEDSSCVFPVEPCEICLDGAVALSDEDGDGVCDGDEIPGCQDEAACNFDPTATDSDAEACVFADGECEACEGGVVILNDADGDGVCDGDEIAGCQDEAACNFDPTATDDDGSCVFATEECATCENGAVVLNDIDGDGICDDDEVDGCQDETACNFNADATNSDPTQCVFANGDCEACESGAVILNDTDGDGVCDGDEIAGCQDETACNFDPTATDSDAEACVFADGDCEACDGGTVILNDTDGDGVCDGDEIAGCQDTTACNFNADATDSDPAQCVFATEACEACEGGAVVLNDTDGDGVCDGDEIAGCQDTTACNFNADATDDDGSCTFLDGLCQTCENGIVVDNDIDGDGICNDDEIGGCLDSTACNYDATATESDPTQCLFATEACETCEGGAVVLNDADGDGVCDGDEIAGCTDNTACNFDAGATDDDGTCEYLDALDICGGTCISDMDNDGICDTEDACIGQYDALGVCNGGCTADLDDDEICDDVDDCVGEYDAIGVCNGNCTADADNDGICDDVDDCVGELDAIGVCNGDCPADQDGDGVCDTEEIFGCTDDTACNFDATATEEDGSCATLDVLGICGGDCTADADNDGVCDDEDPCVGLYDALGDCNGTCAADVDNDDICDDVDDCVGELDAIGVCNGDCPADEDGDGVCDNAEIFGCTDTTACNFNPDATEEDVPVWKPTPSAPAAGTALPTRMLTASVTMWTTA